MVVIWASTDKGILRVDLQHLINGRVLVVTTKCKHHLAEGQRVSPTL